MKKSILILILSFFSVSCGPVICNRNERKCEENKIMVCTGRSWEEIHDCSMYENKLQCSQEDGKFFCE